MQADLMKNVFAIRDEFYKNWVSPDELAWLDSGGPDSSNGILFLAMFLLLLKETDSLNQEILNRSFKALRNIQVAPGLYRRSPTNDSRESHDNYVAVCAIAVLFSFVDARSIVEFGTDHGFAYDHMSPEAPAKETIRQGGEIAFYKLCAHAVPTLWELAWLCIGLALAGIKGSPSVVNLAWLRLKTLGHALKDKAGINLFLPSLVSITFASLIFNIFLRKRFGSIQGSFAQYFKDNHPIRLLSKELQL